MWDHMTIDWWQDIVFEVYDQTMENLEIKKAQNISMLNIYAEQVFKWLQEALYQCVYWVPVDQDRWSQF